MKRIFLGWDQPLAETAAAWLWAQREQLSTMCLVVPTAQAGRRLQEALAGLAAQEHKAVLGLRTVTPAYFIKIHEPDIADESIELLAWMEIMESIEDWTPYHAAFPHPLDDGEGKGWSRPIAQSLMELRYHLQEAGLLIRDAARRMGSHADAARWQALAAIEQRVEKMLESWSLRSRSACLQARLTSGAAPALPNDCTRLVIIGVTEATPLVAQLWQRLPATITLIAAPDGEAEHFLENGFPQLSWSERPQEFPGRNGIPGQVHIVADSRQLAEKTVACIAQRGCSSDQVMLATCDPALGQPIATALARAGWTVFDPASTTHGLDWRVWLRHWQRWLSLPSLAIVAEMAALRETQSITGRGVYPWLRTLSILRDQCLVDTIDDIERWQTSSTLPRGITAEQIGKLLASLHHLQRWRRDFFQNGCCHSLIQLIERWLTDAPDACADAADLIPLLQQWQPWEQRLGYDAAFWMQLLCDRLPPPSPELPDSRALDVEGWLEIPFHHSAHLLVCGLNDQVIPARLGGEPWLNASNRPLLGLPTDAHREARDAFLYHAMLASHRHRGGIDLILHKSDAQGKIHQPSRLLLRASGTELAARVDQLFAELPTSDQQLHWQSDGKWQPRFEEIAPEKDGIRNLSVTALRDYLACPYRFYLRHGLRMNQRDGDRGEWNHRDFGNILHELLENWGNDEKSRDLTDAAALTQTWHQSLNDLLHQRHGKHLPLALQIQSAALRQRLEWLAEIQATHRAQGWQVWKVETPFSLEIHGFRINGKIDRIDYHPQRDSYMMWDYKTGHVKHVQQSHCKTFTPRSHLPAHLADDDRLFLTDEKGKTQRWINLQLPLYAAAHLTPTPPGVGYIAIGDARDEVEFQPWENFHPGVTQAACNCAQFLLERIDQRLFWPPNEKYDYDDFSLLASGSDLIEASAQPPTAPT
jgi:ATP-dependent helicase/nuclease subunit B